jgi:hypothetical protein
VPFADSFYVRERIVVRQDKEVVRAVVSYDVVFQEGARFQGLLKGVALKEIKNSVDFY